MPIVVLTLIPAVPGTYPYRGVAVVNVPATRVEFWVDGSLFRTESFAPYDLFPNGAANQLGVGAHLITAEAFFGSTPLGSDTKSVTEGTISNPRQTARQKLMGLGLTSAEVDVVVNP